MSTRFFPMSWTSPFTVASTIFPRRAPPVRGCCGSRKETAAFMAAALWSTSATINWFALKSRPTSAIPAMRGPFTIDERIRVLGAGERPLQVLEEPLLGPLDDVRRDPLGHREVGARRRLRGRAPRKWAVKAATGSAAAVEEQVLGRGGAPPRGWSGSAGAARLFTMAMSSPACTRVVEEDAVQHLAAGVREAEGDVGDPEDRLRAGERGLQRRTPSIVAFALPRTSRRPCRTGRRAASQTRSSSAIPYSPTRSAWARRAIAIFRSRGDRHPLLRGPRRSARRPAPPRSAGRAGPPGRSAPARPPGSRC